MKSYLGSEPDPNHLYQHVLGKQLYNEVIVTDSYYFREFFKKNDKQIDTIVDIGANIGYFTLLSSILFPSAKKLLVEPNPENIKVLVENFQDFSDITIIPKALGDGKNVKMVFDQRWSGSDTIQISEDGNIESLSFEEILNFELGNYVLKIDCEGGEKYLKYTNLDLFEGCQYFMCEFHESETNTIQEWEEWLAAAFKSSHHVYKKYLGVDTFPLYMYYALKKDIGFNINF